MLYKELPSYHQKAARKLIKDSIDQWEEEVAKEQGRNPSYYSMESDLFKEQLEVQEFEIILDEITRKEELILQ